MKWRPAGDGSCFPGSRFTITNGRHHNVSRDSWKMYSVFKIFAVLNFRGIRISIFLSNEFKCDDGYA